MKNKGFTLVELLAILGVLAVITLITIPIIDSTIKKNKQKLYNSQINSIKASLKTWGDDNVDLLPEDENDPLYVTLGRLKYDGFVDVDIKNPKTKKCFPNNMVLTIKKTGNGYEYFVDAESGNENADDCSIPNTSEDAEHVGDIVYYNPVNNELCSDYSESNSHTGVKEGCMKWYLIENRSGKKNVSVILDHNTTDYVKWNSNNSETTIGDAKTQLESDTSTWNIQSRLITMNEIGNIIENPNWETTGPDNGFYLNVISPSNQYGWLHDRLAPNCTNYGCFNNDSTLELELGYWTSTVYTNDDKVKAWLIDADSSVFPAVTTKNYAGIRPVITISLPLNHMMG